jgi:hypothetical protein
VIIVQVWAGAENAGLAAAILDSGLAAPTETMPALDAGHPRTLYVLRAGQQEAVARDSTT